MGSFDTSLELNFQSCGVNGQSPNFAVAMIWLPISSVAYNASLFPTVELEKSSSYITNWKPAVESFCCLPVDFLYSTFSVRDISRMPWKSKYLVGCVWLYKELWGRGVLRTIQEELLELIIVKYSVPFFYIFITDFQHFSAAVYILKKLTVFAFLQTKSLCILLEETQKGEKSCL